MPTAKEKTTNTTSIRLDHELRDRIERLAARMSEAACGAPITLSIAMRTALERGIAVMERELPKGKR